MKHFLSLIIAILAYSTVFAQTNTNDLTPQDPKAKAILDKLSAKTKALKSLSADFEYRLQNQKAGIDEIQTGSIQVKGNKYRLKLAGQEVICNGTTVWTYLPDDEEVQITNNDEEEEGSFSPSKIFTIYETGFKFKYDKEQVIGGNRVHTIYLYPMEPGEKNFHTIILNVEKETTRVHSMTVKAKDGNIYTYTLKNYQPDQALSDASFDFKVPDGVDEIDLR
jgi:outer membrane lipoprotein carrier protein